MTHPRPAAMAAVVLLAAQLAGCSSEPLPAPEGWERGPARIVRTLRAEGPLLAGAARVPLDPPFAVPMGGYFGGSEFLLRGQRDPLSARAVVLEAGGLRLALVSLDLVLVPAELRPEVEARPEFRDAGVTAWTIFSTHAHTCMGGFAQAWAAQRFGLGSYDPLILRYLAQRSAEAVALAAQKLVPVAAESGEAALPPGEPPLCYNRKVLGRPVDSTLRVLRIWPAASRPQAEDAPLAELVNFAAHPTVTPAHLRSASADYPGVLCRDLEKDGPIALFLQGPSGDIAGGIHAGESRAWWERRLEWMGQRLARLAREALPGAAPAASPQTVLAYSEGEILLPPRRPWRVPLIGRSIARNYPERVRARCLRIGDRALLFFPGELGNDLGAQIRADLVQNPPPRDPLPAAAGAAPIKEPAAAGPREVWVVTLADDYLGYAFSREEYQAGGMSQHLTVYGVELGAHLTARLGEIARACFR